MAYAAGLGLSDEWYLDTLRAGGVVAHPLFSVCLQWATGQAISPPRTDGLAVGGLRHGVHYGHDLVLHRAGGLLHVALDLSSSKDPLATGEPILQ